MATIGFPHDHAHALAHPTRRSQLLRRILLIAGIVMPPLWVVINILGAMQWEKYSFVSQVVSELSAVGAPSRPLMVRLAILYEACALAFVAGVWRSAGTRRSLRITAGLLVGAVLVDVMWFFAPMHMRGAEPTLTDTIHVVLGGVMSLVILLAVGFSAAAFGRGFRLYAAASILIMLAFGAWTGFEAPGVATNQPTPWIGLAERADIGAYLVWLAVLAIALLRERDAADRARAA